MKLSGNFPVISCSHRKIELELELNCCVLVISFIFDLIWKGMSSQNRLNSSSQIHIFSWIDQTEMFEFVAEFLSFLLISPLELELR